MARLNVGSKVLFQLFNTPEGKFYGDVREARVVAIEEVEPGKKKFKIKYQADYGQAELTLQRKEIKRVLS